MKTMKKVVAALGMVAMASSYAGQKNAQMEVTFTVLSQCQTTTETKSNAKDMNITVSGKCTVGSGMYVTASEGFQDLNIYKDKYNTKEKQGITILANYQQGMESKHIDIANKNDMSQVLLTINY